MPSTFQPLPLVRRAQPFSHSDWLFEVKYDGFRALAYLDGSGVRLISRNGNRFGSFDPLSQSIAFFLSAKNAVIDGEIVCLDSKGHSRFNARYTEQNGNPAWIKIKNRNYSQIIGRNELFDREERVEIGWASCAKAYAAVAG
jgi:ATP dependent DNA ligase domain